MSETKPINFRINPETANRFRAFCEELGMNQAQFFDHVMSIFEMNEAKSILPERLTEISEFERYANSMITAYIGSLELAKTTEERVFAQFHKRFEDQAAQINFLNCKLYEKEDMLNEAIATVKELEEKLNISTKNTADKTALAAILQVALNEAEAKLSDYNEYKKNFYSLKDNLQKAEKALSEANIEKERISYAMEKKLLHQEKEKDRKIYNLETKVSKLEALQGEKDKLIEKLECKNEELLKYITDIRTGC